MINGYNDDTLLKESKRLQYHTNFKIMRNAFSQKDKPSQYRINLISLGRVGYSFAEQLLNYMDDDPSFIELNIWHRIARKIEDDKVVDVPPNKRDMYKTLLKIMTGQRKNFHLHDYRTLQDLGEIVRKSNNNPSVGDITVVTPRYDFSFALKDEKKNSIRVLNPQDSLESALIESICQTSIYDNSTNPQTIMKEIIEEREVMEGIVSKVTKETGLRKDRANNLIDNVIGIRELANSFKDYQGNTIIVANEIDTTAYVFAKQSGTDPHKILGLSHNDQIRYTEFLRDNIPKALRDLQLNVPVLGSHNEFITPVYDMILLNDELISDTIESPFDFEKLKQQVADFGLNLFRAQGSSDKDAPKAILHTVKSIMYEDFRDDYVIRASTQFKDKNFFTGIQVSHDNGVAIPHKLEELLLKMNPSEREIFEKGNEIQKFINNELMENGIIPKEWSYQEFEPKKPSVITITGKPTEKPTTYALFKDYIHKLDEQLDFSLESLVNINFSNEYNNTDRKRKLREIERESKKMLNNSRFLIDEYESMEAFVKEKGMSDSKTAKEEINKILVRIYYRLSKDSSNLLGFVDKFSEGVHEDTPEDELCSYLHDYVHSFREAPDAIQDLCKKLNFFV